MKQIELEQSILGVGLSDHPLIAKAPIQKRIFSYFFISMNNFDKSMRKLAN